jgi:hypothetical protein
VLRVSARCDNNSNASYLTFNGTTTGHSYTLLYADGATPASVQYSGGARINFSFVEVSGYTTNTFSNGELYIPSYTASQNKPVGIFAVTENNATTALMGITAGLWSNTAAITSLTLAQPSGNFVTGSSFYLYGI